MNDLAGYLQRAERLCIDALRACDEALDTEDWPAFVNRLDETRRAIARLFDAQRLLVYPRLVGTGMASKHECTQLQEEQARIDVVAQLSSQAAFARDNTRCRALLAVVRDRVMTHWMMEQRHVAALGCANDTMLSAEAAPALVVPTKRPPNGADSGQSLDKPRATSLAKGSRPQL